MTAQNGTSGGNDLRIIVLRDGLETDVTEAVKLLYDQVHSSMDWGSGFLSTEEMAEVCAIADVCGFDPPAVPDTEDDGGKAMREKAADIRALFQSVPQVRP